MLPVEMALRLGIGFMALHLVIVPAAPAPPLGNAAALALDYGSGVFEGIANALVTLLFAHVFSSFTPSISAVGIAVAQYAEAT